MGLFGFCRRGNCTLSNTYGLCRGSLSRERRCSQGRLCTIHRSHPEAPWHLDMYTTGRHNTRLLGSTYILSQFNDLLPRIFNTVQEERDPGSLGAQDRWDNCGVNVAFSKTPAPTCRQGHELAWQRIATNAGHATAQYTVSCYAYLIFNMSQASSTSPP